MKPSASARNFTPSSSAVLSANAAVAGTAPSSQIEHGVVRGPPCSTRPEPGTSRLQLSSTARDRTVNEPSCIGVNV